MLEGAGRDGGGGRRTGTSAEARICFIVGWKRQARHYGMSARGRWRGAARASERGTWLLLRLMPVRCVSLFSHATLRALQPPGGTAGCGAAPCAKHAILPYWPHWV